MHACVDWGGWDCPDIDWSAVEAADHPAARPVEESERAQLVVVGSHGRGGFVGMLLGSVSSAVVQAARTAVLVARNS